MGLLKLDDGASIVDLEEYGMPPCLILKRDGSTLYPTRDIAAAVYRKRTYDFDKCIYVTSNGQSLHFAQWFKVVEMMGYDWADKLIHIPYGTVSIGGEKLATRTGNVILLKDLFRQAIEKVTELMDEKNPDLPDKEAVAESVGVGAVVFHYLYNNRTRDINFILENALSFEGSTGPYAQYTYARTCSILEKAGELAKGDVVITADEEADVLKTLNRFPEKVLEAIEEYEPSVITRYIIDLCTAFNRFYHNCPIISAEDEATRNTRLRITAAVQTVLGRALSLICMKAPKKI
ncbi:MAG: arginine--tRNA ligase, partial [Clostridia bacterium]|nr:arginine--tRNA ligase [Clostridia bacterium]